MKMVDIFPNLAKGKWAKINLNEESKSVSLNLADPFVCKKWIDSLNKKYGANYSYGGFLEDRTYIWRNHPIERGKSKIHLGIDYIVPVGTEVSMPKKGKVIHIMKDFENKLDWGGRILWELEDKTYLLYGHLKQDFNLKIGQICNEGEIVCVVGDINENGNWFPHLHVQIMNEEFIKSYTDCLEKIDGYLPEDNPNLKNVLDPEIVISLKNKTC